MVVKIWRNTVYVHYHTKIVLSALKNHGYFDSYRIDVNNANLLPGMYYGVLGNAPSTYGVLLVLGSGSAWYTSQLYISVTSSNVLVKARSYDGAWSPWKDL